MIACLANPVFAASKGNLNKEKDTISVKCKLFCPNLFYGIELGEKPVPDIVDTLVNEIPYYDTAHRLKVVIVSGKDLGFTNETDISWDAIIDSAENRGYTICPPQLGPELYVLSQNLPAGRTLLTDHVLKGKPLFIGMDRLRHMGSDDEGKQSAGHSIFKRKDYYDFVFCIKAGSKLNSYALGYSVTNTASDKKSYGWTSTDMFIFINNK